MTALQLTFNGMTATISGVQFEWRAYCWACKRQWKPTAPGGRVQVGLRSGTRGHRWMRERNIQPARPFPSPGPCPHCGQPNGMMVNHDHPDGYPTFAGPNRELRDLIDDAYRHLRATCQKESGQADEAMQAEARRNAWNAPQPAKRRTR